MRAQRLFFSFVLCASVLYTACQTLSISDLYVDEGDKGSESGGALPSHLYRLEELGVGFVQISVPALPAEVLEPVLTPSEIYLAQTFIEQILVIDPQLFMAGQGETGSIILEHSPLVPVEEIRKSTLIGSLFNAGGGAVLSRIDAGLTLISSAEAGSPLVLAKAILPTEGDYEFPAYSRAESPLSLVCASCIVLASFTGENALQWLGVELQGIERTVFAISEPRTAETGTGEPRLSLSALMFLAQAEQSRAYASTLRLVLRRELEKMLPGLSASEYRQAIRVENKGDWLHLDAFPISISFVHEIIGFLQGGRR